MEKGDEGSAMISSSLSFSAKQARIYAVRPGYSSPTGSTAPFVLKRILLEKVGRGERVQKGRNLCRFRPSNAAVLGSLSNLVQQYYCIRIGSFQLLIDCSVLPGR